MRTWTIEYDGTMYQALCGSDWLVYVMIYGFLCLGKDRDMAIFLGGGGAIQLANGWGASRRLSY